MNTLLIARPGGGKTTAACSGRKPVYLIDVDKKAREMQNLQPMIKSGDIIVHDIKSKLVAGRLSDRALNPEKPIKEQPEGYIEIIDLLNDIIEGEHEPSKDAKTIVLDSLTRTVEHLKRLLIYHRGKGKFGKKDEGDMNWPSWGSYLSNLEELFTGVGYIEDKDFICTAHLKVDSERDPLTDVEVIHGYRALVDGQMREKLAGYFNEVYYVEREWNLKKHEMSFKLRTKGSNKYDARTSLTLDEFEEANLLGILKKGGLVK